MPTVIKPKQKLNLYWQDNQIKRIELNSDPLHYVELDYIFYQKITEQPFDLTNIDETDEETLKNHMLFLGELVQECIDQNTVSDKLIEIFRNLFWKIRKRVTL